jgi:DNA modification methylase
VSTGLPVPYYDQDGITIYNADCRDILPLLPRVDLVLTDPPYGIGISGQKMSIANNPKHNRKYHEDLGWDKERPCKSIFIQVLEKAESQVLWGGNYFADLLPATRGWFYWDKGQNGLSMSDGELAWTSRDGALRACVLNRASLGADGSVHPTQKPIKLMTWCLSFFPDAQTILDPFMGSGTTLVAAKLLGKKAIGIELEEKYCQIAVERLAQGNLFGAGEEVKW